MHRIVAWSVVILVCFFEPKTQAQNWMKLKNLGGKCTASYILNMKVVERKDSSHAKVNQKSLGYSSVGFIELTTSATKENLPIFGEGFLDIFVEKVKTTDGYDYWKECKPN